MFNLLTKNVAGFQPGSGGEVLMPMNNANRSPHYRFHKYDAFKLVLIGGRMTWIYLLLMVTSYFVKA